MNLDKYIHSLISDSSRGLRARVFVVLTMAATAVVGLALLGDILYRDSIVEIITLSVTLVVVPLITIIGVRSARVDMVAKIISFGVIFIILPIVFFFGGGIEGAVIPWLVFAYLYIGLMLSGIWRISALIIHTVIVAVMFTVGYFYPELGDIHTKEVRYIDVFLAVVEVGYICFVMTWFQNLLFMRENRMAKEETKKVEELSRSQNRFFSNMSHEIRTPINSILGLNEIILRNPEATKEIKKDAENIQGAGRMLLALINDILDFSRIEAGRMDIVPVNYNLAELISEIVNMMWAPAEEKGLTFNVEVDPSIPSELFGDEIRIKQILVNLLNNAVKYTESGSVALRVEKEEYENDHVVLSFSVTDTGKGIKQEVIPYLFDAFKRVDEDSNIRIEGTGLGLSIVKQLVELMDGRIIVSSVYTQGSTFTVTLGQKVTNSDPIGSVDIAGYGDTKTAGAVTGFTAKDVRALIVDDNRMNLLVERKLIEGTGIEIDTAESGDEALARTMAVRYDIILMDHLMPGMDGIECMQHIRKQPGGLNTHVPIIVLTANAGSENRELYVRSGFEDYLIKPVSGHQLEEALLAHLPASKITRNKYADPAMIRMHTSGDYSRKLPVLVSCAGTCDLPASVIRKYQIDTIPYRVMSDGRTFFDVLEADGSELIRYIKEGEKFECEPPTTEEYVTFFGNMLKGAHNLIYISAAAGISPEYERATRAARSFGNVTVIDSGLCSTAVGLLVLIAQRMAFQGESYEAVIDEIERAKERISSTFVLDSTYFLRKRGAINEGIASFSRAIGVRLFVRYNKKSGFKAEGECVGDFDKYHVKFINYSIPRKADPDTDLVVVVHTDLNEDQKKAITDCIKKRCDFKNVVFQRVSAVMPIHMGTEAFGIVYFGGGDYSYRLSSMLLPGGEHDRADEKVQENEKAVAEGKIPAALPGIDRAAGIRNSGSEETFEMLLDLFVGSIPETRDEINGYYEKEDWKNYTVKVHALKSAAQLIGADTLAEDALGLETAAKKDDIGYIRENHSKVMEHLTGFKTKAAGDDFNGFLIDSIFEVLKEGAAGRDEKAINDTFEEADEYTFPPGVASVLERLRTLADRGEYEKMLSVISGLKGSTQQGGENA